MDRCPALARHFSFIEGPEAFARLRSFLKE